MPNSAFRAGAESESVRLIRTLGALFAFAHTCANIQQAMEPDRGVETVMYEATSVVGASRCHSIHPGH